MAELINNLGYKSNKGGSYAVVKKRLKEYGIKPPLYQNKSHKVYADEEIFTEMSGVSVNAIKRRFRELENVEYVCAICGHKGEWNGRPLVLQLDHKDGNNKNNTLDNLRWLCPNCHSQTRTYAGRNNKSHHFKHFYYCKDCGAEITRLAERCSHCAHVGKKKVDWPTKEELSQLLIENHGNFTLLARRYGVIDNTVRKWCKKYGLPYHTKDYRSIA